MGEIKIASVTYENVAIQTKNRLPLNCMFFPSCVVFEPIYGHSVSFSGTGLFSLISSKSLQNMQIARVTQQGKGQHIESCSYIELGLPLFVHFCVQECSFCF